MGRQEVKLQNVMQNCGNKKLKGWMKELREEWNVEKFEKWEISARGKCENRRISKNKKKKQRAKVRGIRKVLEFSKSFEILIYGKCEKFGGNTSVTSSSEKGRRTLGETWKLKVSGGRKKKTCDGQSWDVIEWYDVVHEIWEKCGEHRTRRILESADKWAKREVYRLRKGERTAERDNEDISDAEMRSSAILK